MSTPLDKLFNPVRPIQQDVTAPPRLPIAGEENVGWREFVRQFLPENVRDLVVESTPVHREMEKRRKISAATPYKAEGGKPFVTSKEELSRVQRARYEQMEREVVLPPGAQVLRERQPSLYEKVVPQSIRDIVRPSTLLTESTPVQAGRIAAKVAESAADITNLEPSKAAGLFAILSRTADKFKSAGKEMQYIKVYEAMLKEVPRIKYDDLIKMVDLYNKGEMPFKQLSNILEEGKNIKGNTIDDIFKQMANKRDPSIRMEGDELYEFVTPAGRQRITIRKKSEGEDRGIGILEATVEGKPYIGYLTEFEARDVVKNLAGNKEPINILSDPGVVSFLKTGEGTVGVGFDPSVVKKLGANMYKGELPQVAVKEGIQNAIDAVREKGGGNIEVSINESNRTISIKDNGIGMSPETAAKQLMDIGGSLKGEGASGGYGLAKVALFSNAEKIKIQTIFTDPEGNNILTVINGSGEDWINGNLKIKSHVLGPGDFPQSGTQIGIKLKPEAAPEGKWYGAQNFAREAYQQNKIPGINFDVRINGQQPYWMTELYKPKPMTAEKTVELPNALIDIYPSSISGAHGYTRAKILNRGLFQFDLPHVEVGTGMDVPEHFTFDIRPKVEPEHVNYPFTTSREEVKGEVQEFITDYFRNIKQNIAARYMDQIFEAMNNPFPIGSGTHAVFNTSQRTPRELAQQVANRPYAENITAAASTVANNIFRAIKERSRYGAIPDFIFGGIGLGPEYLGINIGMQSVAEKLEEAGKTLSRPTDKNMILINPFSTMLEVAATSEDYTATARGLAEQTWNTLVHEVVHQLDRGHKEGFAGAFTRVIHSVAPEASHNINILEQLYSSHMEEIFQDYESLLEEWNKNVKGKDIIGSFGGHVSAKDVARGISGIPTEPIPTGMGKTDNPIRAKTETPNVPNIRGKKTTSIKEGSESPKLRTDNPIDKLFH